MPTSLHLNNGVCTKIKTASETFNLEFAQLLSVNWTDLNMALQEKLGEF